MRAEWRSRSPASGGRRRRRGVTAGLPASLGAVRGRSGSRRFFWTTQGRDETAVGAVVVSGVDGSALLREGERAEGRRGSRERERGGQGGVVASPGRRGGSGKQEVAGTRAGALRPHTLVPTGTRLRMTGTWAWWAGFSAGPGK